MATAILVVGVVLDRADKRVTDGVQASGGELGVTTGGTGRTHEERCKREDDDGFTHILVPTFSQH